MKRVWVILSILCLAVAAGPAMGALDGATAMEAQIQQVQDSLERQIERIKDARERAATRMSLARIRIAEELVRSQEDLLRQIETLERLREQLSAQSEKSDGAVEQIRNDWSQRFATVFRSIETQISETNDLMRRLDAIREQVDKGNDDVPLPGNGLPTIALPTTVPITVPTTTTPSVQPVATTPVTPTPAPTIGGG